MHFALFDFNTTQNVNWTCPSDPWSLDRLESCHLQRYVEFYPLLVILLLFPIFTTSAFLISYKSKSRGSANSNSSFPTYTDNVLRQGDIVQPDAVDVGPVQDLFKSGINYIEHPPDRSDKDAFVIIRGKSTSDKLRLLSELICALLEVIIVSTALSNSELVDSYKQYGAWVLPLYVLFASYTALLVLYRVYGADEPNRLSASPFIQCAWLYTFSLAYALIRLYTYVLSLGPILSPGLHVAWVLVSLIKWVILCSSPVGDHVARVYARPGIMPSTEPTSSIFTILLCNWNVEMICNSARKQLTFDDIWELPEMSHSYKITEKYESTNSNWHFFIRLLWAFKDLVFFNGFYGSLGGVFALSPAYFVNAILRYLEHPENYPGNIGWLYVFGLAITLTLSNIFLQQCQYHGRLLAVATRSAIVGELFHKALFNEAHFGNNESDRPLNETGQRNVKSQEEDQDKDTQFSAKSTGAVMNVMSVDVYKIAIFMAYLDQNFTDPLTILISGYYLWIVLGWSAFVGVAVMIFALGLNYSIANKVSAAEKDLMAIRDKRVEKTNEVLSAIAIIKLFGWEQRFASQILNLREQELSYLYITYFWRAFSGATFIMVPILVTASSFSSYVLLEQKELTSSVAFTALSIFARLRTPLDNFANFISDIAAARVSINRVHNFLQTKNTPKYDQLGPNQDGHPYKIGIENATLRWDRSGVDLSSFKLRDIDVSFDIGALNLIIGPTGSGKTSLLLALLGEMYLEKGNIYLPSPMDRSKAKIDPETGFAESVAYCPQQAWLLNNTLRNNILFAQPFNRRRYDAVIKACQLDRDLELLDDGDQALIGDKGIMLSGGQKQRVSIARALYSNSKHLIFDDCLSAVDSHTAESLYEYALTGPLAAGRTVILVSHNVALSITKATKVIVMDNGIIKGSGTPELVSSDGLLGQDELVLKSAQESIISRTNSMTRISLLPVNLESSCDVGNTEVDMKRPLESQATGAIPFSTYKQFASALGGQVWWAVFIFVLLSVPTSQYIQSWWLKRWTTRIETHPVINYLDRSVDNDLNDGIYYYLSIYVAIGGVVVLLSLTSKLFAFSGSLKASRILFKRLLNSTVHARMRFFDSTPVGQMLNRFSKDISSLDEQIMPQMLLFTSSAIDAVSVIIVISYLFTPMVPLIAFMGYASYLVAKVFLSASRELRRFEATSRSPIFQAFGEVLTGAIVIRAFGDTNRFASLMKTLLDINHRPYHYTWLTNRWLSSTSAYISQIVSLVTAIYIVWNHDVIDAGTAGIALTYAMVLSDSIFWATRQFTLFEIGLNSVERIDEYISIEQEAAAIIPESRPPVDWPRKGCIEFDQLSLRYADDLPMVVKNVSFTIEGGTKVGIVGRTGAGKSTIITALFRVLEAARGSIRIDDIDITTIGLFDLRNSLSIIPQDPTLFVGTLRTNLDPFDNYTDDEIFVALSRVNLVPEGSTSNSNIEQVEGENTNRFLNLSSEVTEGGHNLSQGQRQLVCLARAILKKPRILLLDEATASIDYDTDAKIQKTIREQLKDITILTIAHRLRTVADYDRILVLEQGEVKQFDKPSVLLSCNTGLFYEMAKRSGDFEQLSALSELRALNCPR